MSDANEQQYQAEVMAELEQQTDPEYLAWLDTMNTKQECEQ